MRGIWCLVVILTFCVGQRAKAMPTTTTWANVSRTDWAVQCLARSNVSLDSQFLKASREEYLGVYNRTFEATRQLRGLPMHRYRGYRGPWLENLFISKFQDFDPLHFFPVVPLFIQWTDYSRIVHRMKWDWQLPTALNKSIDPRFPYLAISDHDCGIFQFQRLYPNIIVLSGGGNGHAALPLLKEVYPQPSKDEERKRRIQMSFQGSITTSPQRVTLINKLTKYVPCECITDNKQTVESYQKLLKRSIFTIAPYGIGRTSYRMFEAMQYGSMPIYLYNDVPWLPYHPRLDWSRFALVHSITDAEAAGKKAKAILANSTHRQEMQKALQEVYSVFTYESVMEQISYLFTAPGRSLIRCIKAPPHWCWYGESIFMESCQKMAKSIMKSNWSKKRLKRVPC
mmetsp:Transcript_97316/g.167750  ORF Transcript_97316/g.167750 Transcript_97316/m.167750 type:complete len:398 (-) Transcript_97316:1167-2360(-)